MRLVVYERILRANLAGKVELSDLITFTFEYQAALKVLFDVCFREGQVCELFGLGNVALEGELRRQTEVIAPHFRQSKSDELVITTNNLAEENMAPILLMKA